MASDEQSSSLILRDTQVAIIKQKIWGTKTPAHPQSVAVLDSLAGLSYDDAVAKTKAILGATKKFQDDLTMLFNELKIMSPEGSDNNVFTNANPPTGMPAHVPTPIPINIPARMPAVSPGDVPTSLHGALPGLGLVPANTTSQRTSASEQTKRPKQAHHHQPILGSVKNISLADVLEEWKEYNQEVRSDWDNSSQKLTSRLRLAADGSAFDELELRGIHDRALKLFCFYKLKTKLYIGMGRGTLEPNNKADLEWLQMPLKKQIIDDFENLPLESHARHVGAAAIFAILRDNAKGYTNLLESDKMRDALTAASSSRIDVSLAGDQRFFLNLYTALQALFAIEMIHLVVLGSHEDHAKTRKDIYQALAKKGGEHKTFYRLMWTAYNSLRHLLRSIKAFLGVQIRQFNQSILQAVSVDQLLQVAEDSKHVAEQALGQYNKWRFYTAQVIERMQYEIATGQQQYDLEEVARRWKRHARLEGNLDVTFFETDGMANLDHLQSYTTSDVVSHFRNHPKYLLPGLLAQYDV